MNPAIGLLEFSSIARGIEAGDAMAKRSPLEVIRAGTVHPGRFLVLVGGATADVEEALDAGRAIGSVFDELFLPDVHPDVVASVGGVRRVHPDRQVEQREEDEDEDRADIPEGAEAGQRDRPPGDERGERDDDAEQPGVALRIAPGCRVEVDRIVVMVVRMCGGLHLASSSFAAEKRRLTDRHCLSTEITIGSRMSNTEMSRSK